MEVRTAVVAVVGPFAVALVALLVVSRRPDGGRPAAGLLGRGAPPLAGRLVAGGAVDLASERGRWVVVAFTAPGCPPCVAELAELRRFHERHAARGDVRVVSVVVRSSDAEVRDLLGAHPLGWTVVVDSDGAASLAYGVARLPEAYVVAPSGVVVATLRGGVTSEQLDSILGAG